MQFSEVLEAFIFMFKKLRKGDQVGVNKNSEEEEKEKQQSFLYLESNMLYLLFILMSQRSIVTSSFNVTDRFLESQ